MATWSAGLGERIWPNLTESHLRGDEIFKPENILNNFFGDFYIEKT